MTIEERTKKLAEDLFLQRSMFHGDRVGADIIVSKMASLIYPELQSAREEGLKEGLMHFAAFQVNAMKEMESEHAKGFAEAREMAIQLCKRITQEEDGAGMPLEIARRIRVLKEGK